MRPRKTSRQRCYDSLTQIDDLSSGQAFAWSPLLRWLKDARGRIIELSDHSSQQTAALGILDFPLQTALSELPGIRGRKVQSQQPTFTVDQTRSIFGAHQTNPWLVKFLRAAQETNVQYRLMVCHHREALTSLRTSRHSL